jgi:hypothetical protein
MSTVMIEGPELLARYVYDSRYRDHVGMKLEL